MVFDKTGTLTEDGLQVLGVRAVSGRINDPETKFEEFEESIQSVLPKAGSEDPEDKKVALNEAMACCHSITVIKGENLGDPLDIKMFEST